MGSYLDRMVAELHRDRETYAKEDAELNQIAGITENVRQSDGNWIADLGLDNPKVVEILKILRANLFLVQPTLNFVQQKNADVARASLIAAVGQEEFDRMAEQARQQELVG